MRLVDKFIVKGLGDGYMHEWMDGWMDGWINEWMQGWITILGVTSLL